MKTVSDVKNELKKGALAFIAAVAVILPLFGITLYQQLKGCAYNSAASLTELVWITTPIIRISLELNIIWVILLVLGHYSKDTTVFDNSRPHSNKKIILNKGFAAFIITAAISLAYFAISAFFCFKYRWLLDTMYWCIRQTSVDSFDLGFMALMSLTVFVFCLAFYWYAALCCCVSRSAATGFVLAALGVLSVLSLINFLNYCEFHAASSLMGGFKNMLAGTVFYNYAFCILVLIFSFLLLIISMPAAILLYSEGNSKHPFFRHRAADIATMLFIAAVCAFYMPTLIDDPEANIPVIAIISGICGFSLSFAANRLITKNNKKTQTEEAKK
ncbi:MAG: hypothetical protein IJR59_05500 [Firmicutes bacterium]|nr:hypothetical protein [Bacillota bacterium]